MKKIISELVRDAFPIWILVFHLYVEDYLLTKPGVDKRANSEDFHINHEKSLSAMRETQRNNGNRCANFFVLSAIGLPGLYRILVTFSLES